jgi:hypothetical protein
MRSPADIASELDDGLKQLFDAGLALSLQVQANATAAEPDEQARLSLTFHRLSRGVRQTAALRMRLVREAERAGREAAAEIVDLQKARVERRKGQLKAAIGSLIWTEAEGDDSTLSTDLEELLDIETQDPETFEEEDLDEQVRRFAEILGLDPPFLGEVSAKPTEGASTQISQRPVLSGPPQSVPDSSPERGASSDDDWRPSG